MSNNNFDFKNTTDKIKAGAGAFLKDAEVVLKDAAVTLTEASKDIFEKFKPYKRVDSETETVLEFNFAGFAKEDIKVRIDEARHTLTIIADKKIDIEGKSYRKVFNLPVANKAKDVKSIYKNGLLTVSIRRVDGSKLVEKDIEIQE